jgi:hypothetical protein
VSSNSEVVNYNELTFGYHKGRNYEKYLQDIQQAFAFCENLDDPAPDAKIDVYFDDMFITLRDSETLLAVQKIFLKSSTKKHYTSKP